MLCKNPYIKKHSAYPCGRCAPCLKHRRRTWAHRITLEALSHSSSAFITLTYSDEYLPKGGSLAPEETRDWLKRIRTAVSPHKLRYYLVGEYGDQTWRPHYHVALFGYPICAHGMSRYNRERESCCKACDLVRDTWGRGNIYSGSLGTKSAQYIAGYVTKKMTRFDDPRLQYRMLELGVNLHPEFCRMSLKPGLGADYLHELASTIMEFDLAEMQGDVPSSLRHGSRLLPLGRYLRSKLRVLVGMKDGKAPQETLDAMEAEVFELLLTKGVDAKSLQAVHGEARRTLIKNALVDAAHQRNLNADARAEIFKQKRNI